MKRTRTKVATLLLALAAMITFSMSTAAPAQAWSGQCVSSTGAGCVQLWNLDGYHTGADINVIITCYFTCGGYDFNLHPGEWARNTQNPSTYDCLYLNVCVKAISVGAGWCVMLDFWSSSGWQQEIRLLKGPGRFALYQANHNGESFRASAVPCAAIGR